MPGFVTLIKNIITHVGDVVKSTSKFFTSMKVGDEATEIKEQDRQALIQQKTQSEEASRQKTNIFNKINQDKANDADFSAQSQKEAEQATKKHYLSLKDISLRMRGDIDSAKLDLGHNLKVFTRRTVDISFEGTNKAIGVIKGGFTEEFIKGVKSVRETFSHVNADRKRLTDKWREWLKKDNTDQIIKIGQVQQSIRNIANKNAENEKKNGEISHERSSLIKTYYTHERERQEKLHNILLLKKPEEKEILDIEYQNELDRLQDKEKQDENLAKMFNTFGRSLSTLNNNFVALQSETADFIASNQNTITNGLNQIHETVLDNGDLTSKGQEAIVDSIESSSNAQAKMNSAIAEVANQNFATIAENLTKENGNIAEGLQSLTENQLSTQKQTLKNEISKSEKLNQILNASLIAGSLSKECLANIVKNTEYINTNIRKSREENAYKYTDDMKKAVNSQFVNKTDEYKGLTGGIFRILDKGMTFFANALSNPYQIVLKVAEGAGESVGKMLLIAQTIIGNIGMAIASFSPSIGNHIATLIPSLAKALFGIDIPNMLIFPPSRNQILEQQVASMEMQATIQITIAQVIRYCKDIWTYLHFGLNVLTSYWMTVVSLIYRFSKAMSTLVNPFTSLQEKKMAFAKFLDTFSIAKDMWNEHKAAKDSELAENLADFKSKEKEINSKFEQSVEPIMAQIRAYKQIEPPTEVEAVLPIATDPEKSSPPNITAAYMEALEAEADGLRNDDEKRKNVEINTNTESNTISANIFSANPIYTVQPQEPPSAMGTT